MWPRFQWSLEPPSPRGGGLRRPAVWGTRPVRGAPGPAAAAGLQGGALQRLRERLRCANRPFEPDQKGTLSAAMPPIPHSDMLRATPSDGVEEPEKARRLGSAGWGGAETCRPPSFGASGWPGIWCIVVGVVVVAVVSGVDALMVGVTLGFPPFLNVLWCPCNRRTDGLGGEGVSSPQQRFLNPPNLSPNFSVLLINH